MPWRIALTVFLCLFATVAEARPKQARHDSAALTYCASDGTYRADCGQDNKQIQRVPAASGDGVIGRRPAGCPRRFCGCEASLYLFGKIDPYLNLAANWLRRFPRANPAPRMAAARPGHVMVLLAHVGGDDWLVRDGNSGGGYTREHVRSIRGFRIVDPNGSRVAGQ